MLNNNFYHCCDVCDFYFNSQTDDEEAIFLENLKTMGKSKASINQRLYRWRKVNGPDAKK
jgi:hypothetical protein